MQHQLKVHVRETKAVQSFASMILGTPPKVGLLNENRCSILRAELHFAFDPFRRPWGQGDRGAAWRCPFQDFLMCKRRFLMLREFLVDNFGEAGKARSVATGGLRRFAQTLFDLI